MICLKTVLFVLLTLLIVTFVSCFLIYICGCKSSNSDTFVNTEEIKNVTSSLVIPCIPEDIPKLDALFQTIQKQTILPSEVIIGLSETSDKDAEFLKLNLEKLLDNVPVKVNNTTDQAYAGINRNRATEGSIGDYIMYMDADDTLHPQRTEIILSHFITNDPIAIVHNHVSNPGDLPKSVDKWSTTKGKEMTKIERDNPPLDKVRIGLPLSLHHGHLSIKRKVWEDGLRYSDRPRGQDAEFIRDLIKKYSNLGDKNLNYIRVPLSVYLQREAVNGVKKILENSYVITLNTIDLDFDKVNLIDRRVNELEESFQYYELPYRIFYGLYYDGTDHIRSKETLKEIKDNYPYIQLDKLKKNGEVGLLASFLKLLESTEDSVDEYITIYEDDAKPTGPKLDFWRKFNYALVYIPYKSDPNYPGVYRLSYTNYCTNSCPDTNKWYKGYKVDKGAGSHALILKKAAVVKILKWCKENGAGKSVDMLLYYLNAIGVIRVHTWEGESSNGGMFCGLFSQYETFCDKRNSLIIRS
jgi:glycosyltransferase involved in cell wall biosynthesis